MSYPVVSPTSRSYDPGNWPVRTYNSQDGTEIRFLYGSKRSNLKLSLVYANISDRVAEEFLLHYNETMGTYLTFAFSHDARMALLAGWRGIDDIFHTQFGSNWRYAEPPRLESVRPWVSTVSVTLVEVL